jgi:hypothetical protein
MVSQINQQRCGSELQVEQAGLDYCNIHVIHAYSTHFTPTYHPVFAWRISESNRLLHSRSEIQQDT